MTFDDFELLPRLKRNVQAGGWQEPTPIQRETIPLVLSGEDVLGCAQTGTGKTAAFALPMLQRFSSWEARPDATVIRGLILTPTRELAQQIYDNFTALGKGLPPRCAVLYGGVGQNAQVEALHRGADIVIACPGRLWDLMNQGYVRLDWVEVFVLDEADRMLDMGFIHDVKRIVSRLPQQRQTLLFSATMPDEVESLAMELLRDPKTVKVDPPSSPVEAIDQWMYYIDKGNKKYLLAQLLRDPAVESALVFSRTKHGVDRIVRDLKRAEIDACGIHGDKTQNQRQKALDRFKSGESKVLVATDIAARGLDIEGLSHVINYDLPMEPEAYIHRIGRTGRAGRGGTAISFCCIDEVKQLNQVERLLGHRIREEKSDWPMEITTPTDPKTKQQPQRPAKVNARGEAVPDKPAQAQRVPKAQRAPQTQHTPQAQRAKSQSAPTAAPRQQAQQPKQQPRPSSRNAQLGKPVRRVKKGT